MLPSPANIVFNCVLFIMDFFSYCSDVLLPLLTSTTMMLHASNGLSRSFSPPSLITFLYSLSFKIILVGFFLDAHLLMDQDNLQIRLGVWLTILLFYLFIYCLFACYQPQISIMKTLEFNNSI